MKKERILLLVLIALCIVWGYVGLKIQVGRYVSDSDQLFEVPPALDHERFFQFSPAEEFVLDERKELWPELFNSKNPPTISSLPLLYRKLTDLARAPELNTLEIMELRQWSVLANSDHADALKRMLLEGIENEKNFQKVLRYGSARGDYLCSLRNQDRAFRLMQLHLFEKEALPFLEKCNPSASALVWFEISRAIEAKDHKKYSELAEKLQQAMTAAGNRETFSRWYSLELFQLTHILKNQQTEPTR